MDEQTKEDGGIDPAQQYENEDDDDFDPFLHAVVPRNLYHKFQIEGSKRWGPPTEILPFLFLGSCFCANEEELLRELGVDHILNVAEECPPPPTVANRKEGEKLVKHYMMVDVVEHIRKSENQWNTFESCFNFIDKARVAYEGKNGGGKKRRGSKRMKRPGKDGEEKTGERKGSGMKIRLGLKTGKDKEGGASPPEGGATGGDRVLVHCMHGRSRSATIVLAYLMKKEGWTLREAYVHVKLRRPIVGPDKYLKHQLIDYEKHLFGKSSFQNVEEFRDFQVQLTPELELKEKERKQKLKEEALQQEQSSSSNDSNTTKAGEDGGEEAEHCNKEMTADGEEEEEEEESSGNNGNADNKDEDEGKGSGKKAKKKKKKQSKKNKKASDEESTAAGTEASGEEKRKKTKNKEKSKKRKDGSTSSGSATGSPRQDEEGEEGECNNRKRGGSVASVSKDEPVKTKKKKKKLTTANSNDQPSRTTQA